MFSLHLLERSMFFLRYFSLLGEDKCLNQTLLVNPELGGNYGDGSTFSTNISGSWHFLARSMPITAIGSIYTQFVVLMNDWTLVSCELLLFSSVFAKYFQPGSMIWYIEMAAIIVCDYRGSFTPILVSIIYALSPGGQL